MFKNTKVKKIAFIFFVTFFGILLLAFSALSMWLDNLIINAQIEQARTSVASHIQMHSREFLEPQSFIFGSEQQALGERFTALFYVIQTPEIVRIKVWDMESRIIFSDNQDIIGKSFPENEALKTTLDGHVVSTIMAPTKTENVGEAQYSQLLEMYVPIYFEGNSRPVGVVEVYYKLDEINALITSISSSVAVVMFSVAGSLFVAAWILFWFLIRKQFISLAEVAYDRAEELERDNKLMIGREVKMVELKKEIEELKKRINK